MGWLISLGILVLLGCLPLGIRLRYDESGFQAAVLLGKIHLRVYPQPPWLERFLTKPKKEPKKAAPSEAPKVPAPPQKAPSGGSMTRFIPFVGLGLEFLGNLRRKLRVNELVCRIILAGEDPCDLAVNYGKAWAALGNLVPRLEEFLVIRKRDLEVECDFLAEEIKVTFAMDLTITLGRILGLVLGAGFKALKLYLNMKKEKAVQTNE